jgi:hypothetical protein
MTFSSDGQSIERKSGRHVIALPSAKQETIGKTVFMSGSNFTVPFYGARFDHKR